MAAEWHDYATRDALAEGLTETVAARLAAGIAGHGSALLAVSGGSTPPLFLRALSQREIDWSRVTVTLVDERFVPPDSERSNARMVTLNLLQNAAAAAHFLPLNPEAGSAEEAAAAVRPHLLALKLPFDVVVLGMGTDGHTASFFPDADRLAEALDPKGKALILPIRAPSAPEPRLTLTLSALALARYTALHIEGAEKRAVLESALGGEDLPVAHIFHHAANPVEIHWAPDEDRS